MNDIPATPAAVIRAARLIYFYRIHPQDTRLPTAIPDYIDMPSG